MNRKVIFALVDGLRPDAIDICSEPFFENLKTRGTYCMDAQSIVPALTLPCHTSIFYSVSPERHGITDNHFHPFARELDGLWETARKFEKRTAAFYDWEELRDLGRPGTLAYSRFHRMVPPLENVMQGEEAMLQDAILHINEHSPDLVFFYLGSVDWIGHKAGWLTPEYMETVAHAQRCIKRLQESISADYTLIISADHGGAEKTHRFNLPTDLTIPMLFVGAPFTPGLELHGVRLLDIAPTICTLLGLPHNEEWEGKSLLSE